MGYDEESFWTGVVLGQQMKGWASTGESGALSEIEVQAGPSDFVEKPAAGFYGIGKVLVRGDEDLIPENIKNGITIFGVTGDYTPAELKLTTGYATITENGVTTIYPANGYKGLSKVQVSTEVPTEVVLQEKTVTPGRKAQSVAPDTYSGYTGLGRVYINGDDDLIGGNIREGVNIFGVEGTYSNNQKLQDKTVTPGRGTQVVTADSGDGFTSLERVYVQGDGNLIGSNIREGASIFGVEGTYSSGQKYQDKTVTPTASGFTVNSDSDYNALASVRVNGDSNLKPDNIAAGQTIFGVRGTYVTPMQTITVVPSADEQVIYPADDSYGFNEIIVAPTAGRQPLKNPASAPQILSGYEAYDAAGNVISGTAFLTGGNAEFTLSADGWNGTTYTVTTTEWLVETGQIPLMDLPFTSSAVNAQRVVEAGITMPRAYTNSGTTTIVFSAVRTPPVDVKVAVFNITAAPEVPEEVEA